MIRYRVLPGYVISKNDGQWHWINEHDLIRLYWVPPNECLIGEPRAGDPSGLTELRPRYDGNYTIPKATK